MQGFINELIERGKRSKILAALLYFFGLSLRKDETILRVGDRKVFVWAAIDVETREYCQRENSVQKSLRKSWFCLQKRKIQ